MFYNFVNAQKCRELNRSPVICENVFFFSVQFNFLSGHSVKTIDPSIILHINKICIFVCSIILFIYKKAVNSTVLPLFAIMSFFFRKSGQFTYLSGHSVETVHPSVILYLNKNMYCFTFYNFVQLQKCRKLKRSPVICENLSFF